MSASDHLQHEQLRMFMTPREIEAEYRPGDFADSERAWGWAFKKAEAEDPREWGGPSTGTLAENIRKNGVQHPISLRIPREGDRYINDGHHRLAVAREQPDRYVPVEHR